ncbi:bifunctional RNase H/acid phosphatase [Corynebacterium choanae]|uniref:Phosphoserine phosphatase 1 n=1 Tax=Corynebacterium choanae TaxID=1862358 RepID=A0A3G6JBG6_9CORY|nr:bifunctional RNase H/acid phosphatase [Corynebacterium choanae]AZA14010.1 Phosphoserine phosphatase 1 [Corynebacterium choanae]
MKVIIHADGGSRGNPGPAGAGSVLSTSAGDTLVAIAQYVGKATNNVAEYQGLINALTAAAHMQATEVACFLDSKLVVEQMSGRWKVKNPTMQQYHALAQQLVKHFAKATFRWIPRNENATADRLANIAMDQSRAAARTGGFVMLDDDEQAPGGQHYVQLLIDQVPVPTAGASHTRRVSKKAASHQGSARPAAEDTKKNGAARPDSDELSLFDDFTKTAQPARGQNTAAAAQADAAKADNGDGNSAVSEPAPQEVMAPLGDTADATESSTDTGHAPVMQPVTLLLCRHGETVHTQQGRYSGGGSDPDLTERGVMQAHLVAARLLADTATGWRWTSIDQIWSSPLRRAQHTAQVVAQALGVAKLSTTAALAEMDFGSFDGKTFAEAQQLDAVAHNAMMQDPTAPCPAGESVADVQERVDAFIDSLAQAEPGSTFVLVSHVGPLKAIVRRALSMPLTAGTALLIDPASVSVVQLYADGPASVLVVNDTAHLR